MVCGGRDYNSDRNRIWNTPVDLDIERKISVAIQGAATGADSEGTIWAQTCGKKHALFHPDWHKHGRAAGPIRNQRMIDEGKPDLVTALPGGRGTADMVSRARAAGIAGIEGKP